MEEILLKNCIKQYQILITAIKGYLTSMYKDELHYDAIKRNLFTCIKMVNAAEELMKVYNNDEKNN